MSSSSLLDEIAAEHHNELLERGNLKKKQNPWNPSPVRTWTPAGYFARISYITCSSCGSINTHLQGVFYRETSGPAVRDVSLNLSEISRLEKSRITPQFSDESVPICAECVTL